MVVWAPSYFLVDDFDTYQLLINTPTTIITFLLVALLQNTQRRAERAFHKKLDALADGMADLMRHFAQEDNELHKEIEDLKEKTSRRQWGSKRRCRGAAELSPKQPVPGLLRSGLAPAGPLRLELVPQLVRPLPLAVGPLLLPPQALL